MNSLPGRSRRHLCGPGTSWTRSQRTTPRRRRTSSCRVRRKLWARLLEASDHVHLHTPLLKFTSDVHFTCFSDFLLSCRPCSCSSRTASRLHVLLSALQAAGTTRSRGRRRRRSPPRTRRAARGGKIPRKRRRRRVKKLPRVSWAALFKRL